jgi:short-subunit dehydrogenase
MARAGEIKARYGPWAVIAGASEGIGGAFARRLAGEGLNLVLIARRPEPLHVLAEELKAAHGIETLALPFDLASSQLEGALAEALEGREVGLGIYNAAYSNLGAFLEQPLEKKQRVVDVNIRGMLVFADVLGSRLARQGRGGLVLMGSLSGFQGSPLIATYAASKAFIRVFAESLWAELGQQGVDVLACIAGATRTPGYESSKPRAPAPLQQADEVVTEALSALGRKPVVVTGGVNRLASFVFNRLLPRSRVIRIMERQMRRMYPDN